MKKIILLLLYIIFMGEVKAQIYHYVLQEFQLNIPGEKEKIVGFYLSRRGFQNEIYKYKKVFPETPTCAVL